MIWNHGKMILEALLLASPEPLTLKRIAEVMGIDERDAALLMADLQKDYEAPHRGLAIREMAGGYVLTTRPEAAEYVERLLQPRARGLSHAALETLAIIAYRQPITKAEIESVRGVKVDRALETLLERGLIEDKGRKDAPGRPILYGTTAEFLRYFGLKELSELPPVEIDTAEPGLIVPTRSGSGKEERKVQASLFDGEGQGAGESAGGEAGAPAVQGEG
ncbi:MAG: SMC-Scp complex subunit ScpB [Bacillota bacterium]|nr:MAG: SMC-Scp complex subunit ScpB [Bacillota bacterium]